MIKEKTISIKIHSPKYYKNLMNIEPGDVIDIDVNQLPKGSHEKITAICDICDGEKITMYKSYIKMTQYDGKYYCVKCRDKKTSQSNIEKHGVKNVMQLDSVKNKMYETNLERYGYICSGQNSDIKEKAKQTCLEKYGVDNFFKSDEMREKVKNTNLNRYGVENVMQVPEINEKNVKSHIKNYYNKFKIDINSFYSYNRKVRRLTKRNIKELFDRWDGYDYYDGEYIKDNLTLFKPKSKNYPSVDHKISIFFGFMNGIKAEEIAYLNNLCITKHYINSSKNRKDIGEFSKNNKINFKMKTKIICILDRSGSMSSIIKDAIGGFNVFLKDQQEVDEIATMDILLFDTYFDKVVSNVDVRKVKPMTEKTYVPRGGTALYDAIGRTIDSELDFLAQNPNNRPDKTLCVILTDGEENSSREYNREKIKMMIEEMEKEFKWNFIFLAANQDAMMTAGGMGIAAGKSMNFAASGEGVTVAYQKMSKATSYYRTTKQENYDNIFEESNKEEDNK